MSERFLVTTSRNFWFQNSFDAEEASDAFFQVGEPAVEKTIPKNLNNIYIKRRPFVHVDKFAHRASFTTPAGSRVSFEKDR